MKKITAYFPDAEKAKATAFSIAQTEKLRNEVILESVQSDSIQLFGSAAKGIVIGALIGFIAGISSALISDKSFLTYVSPVSGFISGAVLGAVSGCMVDFLNYEDFPECSALSTTIEDEELGLFLQKIKKRGALKIILYKK